MKAATVGGATSLAVVRDLLNENLQRVVEFMRRANEGVGRPSGRPVTMGTSIYQLFLFLEAAKGKKALLEFSEAVDLKGQAADASKSVARVAVGVKENL